ncbi:hypothetical protein J4H86_09240 [Spiractinospora alimapuensis]|uniref:TPR repeat region-containing protein n=1 Tax=Spiractinospora alimapuensis TaxID=2820884 RepID=UPI001F26CC3A|nr:hypothetical protein [Spiractinospora alimapuensis]QVQ53871.1 hypothetical protein J4H86_09240 [Spiractinospora alimapuensis]
MRAVGAEGEAGDIAAPEPAEPGAEAIREKADALWDLVGVVTGNAGDMRAAFSSMATTFSEVVSADITREADYDEATWGRAAFTLAFAAEIAHQWADDVETYDQERLALFESVQRRLTMFRANAPRLYQMETGQSPYVEGMSPIPSLPVGGPVLAATAAPAIGTVSDTEHDEGFYNPRSFGTPTEAYLAWRQERVRQIVAEYHSEAETFQEQLVETGEDRARTLEAGPDDELAVRQLIEAGYLGWSAFNMLGAESNPPLPLNGADGRAWAGELEAYLKGIRPPDARLGEILTAVSAIGAEAKALQPATTGQSWDPAAAENLAPSGDTALHRSEIDFLSNLLGDLDGFAAEPDADGQEAGTILDLPEMVSVDTDTSMGEDGQAGLDPGQANDIVGALGDSMLMVSNENLGGGYDRLPDSVRAVAEGSAAPTPIDAGEGAGNPAGWLQSAGLLNAFLSQADAQLRGGREFSGNLLASAGHHLSEADTARTADPTLASVVEVATRNTEASYSLLTDQHSQPSTPTPGGNADALTSLYAHDWPDDGRAVAGLTNWIPAAASSDDPVAQARAQESALGLVHMLTGSDERLAALGDGGQPHPNGDSPPRAGFAEVNPALASSLTSSVLPYLDTLRAADPTTVSDAGQSVSHPDPGRVERLIDLLAADPASAERLRASVDEATSAAPAPTSPTQ